MSELARFVVLVVAFVAFILAAYLQGGGTWHGPHSLRKSFHPNGAAVGVQNSHTTIDQRQPRGFWSQTG
jgi:hypothetical protein